MERFSKYFILLSGLLFVLILMTVRRIAPSIPGVVVMATDTGRMGFILLENFLMTIVLFIAGYPFSKMIFNYSKTFETIFTSLMISFVFFGWVYMLMYLFRGLETIYQNEGALMAGFLAGMIAIGYLLHKVVGVGND